jgi:hypothetical protein
VPAKNFESSTQSLVYLLLDEMWRTKTFADGQFKKPPWFLDTGHFVLKKSRTQNMSGMNDPDYRRSFFDNGLYGVKCLQTHVSFSPAIEGDFLVCYIFFGYG